MKAIGMDIFGGSQTIGHLKEGWEIDTILEMTDDMLKINAYHFHKNYPNINIRLPKYYENDLDDYINKYDLLFANPPCSGLSSVNRWAKVDSDINNHIYNVINVVNKIKPKAFLIENATTLVSLGLPILKKINGMIKDEYRLLIISDLAGNHNVPMKRRRTLVVGWRRDTFNGIPLIEQHIVKTPIGEFLKNTDGLPNMEVNDETDNAFQRFYYLTKPYQSINLAMTFNYDQIKNELTEKEKHQVDRFRELYYQKHGVWDKSSFRSAEDGFAPSMASVVRLMHPTENRDLYIREYARLMGYPDDFIFYPNECECSTIQCLAQGVPVNFIRYISSEIRESFNGNRPLFDTDVLYINQVSGSQRMVKFTSDEFERCQEISKNENKENKEVSLWFNED